MTDAWFVVYLKNGFSLGFDCECNQVDYSDNKVLKCYKLFDDGKSKLLLALVPYDEILYVLRKENME